jgi:PKD repeat protein
MRWVLLVGLLVAASLAGCAGSDSDSTATATGTGTKPTGTGAANPTATTTTPGQPSGASARLVADNTEGQAPLDVNFSLSASKGANSWTLSFGDGSPEQNGSELPASRTHTYSIGGTYTAQLTVTFKDGKTATDSVELSVAAPAGEKPSEVHFEYGPSMGCAGDLAPAPADKPCASFHAGPTGAPPADGFWQPVDERYWGLAFETTITSVLGDSDCFFVAEDQHTILGDANNVDKPCGGVVPVGTAWIFLYSWVEPAQAMTMTFKV